MHLLSCLSLVSSLTVLFLQMTLWFPFVALHNNQCPVEHQVHHQISKHLELHDHLVLLESNENIYIYNTYMIMRKECFEVCIKLNESQVWVCIGLITQNWPNNPTT